MSKMHNTKSSFGVSGILIRSLASLSIGGTLASSSMSSRIDAGMIHTRRVSLAFQSTHHSRRDLIENMAQSIIGAGMLSTTTIPNGASATSETQTRGDMMKPYSVYQIIPDASAELSPYIKPVESWNFVQHNLMQEGAGVIWLGEHHNSARDHDLQAHFIQNIYNLRLEAMNKANKRNRYTNKRSTQAVPVEPEQHKMSIGLEQIQLQFQPALDAFVAGNISEEQMLEQTQWSTRWTWPYENYRPVFDLARQLNIPLVALNVNGEDLAKVKVGGIRGLEKSTIKRYIKNPAVFSEFTRSTSYKAYCAYVIEPCYELHKEMGMLKTNIPGQIEESDMSFINFFTGRILWDESMAGNAFEWTKKNEDGIMIGLVGADHIKFEKGVVGRYQKMVEAEALKKSSASSVGADAHTNIALQGTLPINISVLLNPTLIDSRPSGSVSTYMNADSSEFPDRMTLQLSYLKDDISPWSGEERELPSSTTGGVLPLADYIVISNTMKV